MVVRRFFDQQIPDLVRRIAGCGLHF